MKTLGSEFVLKGTGMCIKRLMAAFGLCLFGLLGPAWAADEVGAALCQTCHDEDDRPDISKTAHGFTVDKRVPDCISCHGPSPTHAKKPADVPVQPHPDRMFGKKSPLPASERSAACLSCHAKDAKRVLWSGSQHDAADIACSACHKIHDNRDKVRERASQAEVCYTCHKEQRAQMNRPSHHPVPEGKMVCSDCHNPHGSAGPKLLQRDSINDTCYTCHAEKRGPFVHQHDPVAEDCSTCHNVHGTTIASMLKSRPPLLCQQCHTPHTAGGVGALAGQNGVNIGATSSGKNVVNLWQGRSCLNCHTQIHGSNNPSTLNSMPQLMMR
jgi:DmsE family decaheme c-type cytochrome